MEERLLVSKRLAWHGVATCGGRVESATCDRGSLEHPMVRPMHCSRESSTPAALSGTPAQHMRCKLAQRCTRSTLRSTLRWVLPWDGLAWLRSEMIISCHCCCDSVQRLCTAAAAIGLQMSIEVKAGQWSFDDGLHATQTTQNVMCQSAAS